MKREKGRPELIQLRERNGENRDGEEGKGKGKEEMGREKGKGKEET